MPNLGPHLRQALERKCQHMTRQQCKMDYSQTPGIAQTTDFDIKFTARII